MMKVEMELSMLLMCSLDIQSNDLLCYLCMSAIGLVSFRKLTVAQPITTISAKNLIIDTFLASSAVHSSTSSLPSPNL